MSDSATPSLGFSRQEQWSGLPFPSPMHKSAKWKWSRSVMSDSSRPHGLQPTRLLHPWDFPGKSTGVGCHCLLRVFCNMDVLKYFEIRFGVPRRRQALSALRHWTKCSNCRKEQKFSGFFQFPSDLNINFWCWPWCIPSDWMESMQIPCILFIFLRLKADWIYNYKSIFYGRNIFHIFSNVKYLMELQEVEIVH